MCHRFFHQFAMCISGSAFPSKIADKCISTFEVQSQPEMYCVLCSVMNRSISSFSCRTLDNISVNKQLRSLQSIGTKRRIRLLDLDTEVKIMIEVAVDNII